MTEADLSASSARDSTFTLSFVQSGSKYTVLFGRGDHNSSVAEIHQAPIKRVEDDVLPLIRNTLESVRKELTLNLDYNNAPDRPADALKEMYRQGLSIWQPLIGNRGLIKLWSCMRQYREKNPGMIPSIEFKAPADWVIPFEILPLDSFEETELPPIPEQIKRYAKLFPAFSAEIRQIGLTPADGADESSPERMFGRDLLPSNKKIPGKPFIPLLFLWHEGGPQATEGMQAVWSLPDTIRSDGPFPSVAANNTSAALARLLLEQGISLPSRGIPYGIVHVHAHGEIPTMKDIPDLTVAGRYKLRFGYKKPAWFGFSSTIEEVEVSNGDLASVTTRDMLSAPLAEAGPFIFINACGGNAPSFSGGLGLAKEFLERGYRAVIGPRVSIPGQVAEYMAKRFYEHLLAVKGCTLGKALLLARNDLLNVKLNPLGALYTIFGESLLNIEQEDSP